MKSRSKPCTVCVVGIWHLGAVSCVGFAEKGYRVIGLELDCTRRARLERGIPPLHEPDLRSFMRRHLGSGRLTFTSAAKAVREADFAILAHDTPVNAQDEVDTSVIFDSAAALAPFLRPQTPLVVSSQVPLGTSEEIEAEVARRAPSWRSGVAYVPENLRLGSAIARFLAPDMLVLGANRPLAQKAVRELYRPFRAPKLCMDLRSAEMVKHALNTFLATSISFINEIALLSDRLGADAVAVGAALRHDRRIGKAALLTPGLGFSGGTLARDVTQLTRFASHEKVRAPLLEAILAVNQATFDAVISKLEHATGGLSGKRIGVLGLTYKPGTSTVRRSPALCLMRSLVDRKALCSGYDPEASVTELREHSELFSRVRSARELARTADALVLVTEWPEFRELDYAALAKLMKKPVLIDSKNYLDPETLVAAGFEYHGFGRSGMPPRGAPS